MALCLTVLTMYDQSAQRPVRDVPHPASSSTEAGNDGVGEKRQRLARLRHMRDNADVIRRNYAHVSVPYAESIAGFAALHGLNVDPLKAVEQAVRDLLPAGVELKEIIVGRAGKAFLGVETMSATVMLSSGDSRALSAALINLGNAANGVAWRGLSLGVDAASRQIRVKGEITVLAVEQAE